MKDNLRPLSGIVLAEPIEDDLEANGVYLPESVKDKPAKGRVISGEGYKAGDVIIFKRWNATSVKDKGKEVLFIAVADILGIYDS